MKAQLEGGLGAPHQAAAEPLCCAPVQHHLLPGLPASGQPEVLRNLVLNAAVGGHGRMWFRQRGLQMSIGVSRKEESKGWKRIEERVGRKHRGSAEDPQAPHFSSSVPASASH